MLFNQKRRLVMLMLMLATLLAWSAVRADDYQLGPGDLLNVTVFDHPELGLETRVSQSGNISLPLAGVLKVGGLSTQQTEQLIARRLSEGGFVRQPQVSVMVNDFQSQKVSVVGQVNKPGQYALSQAATVLDVLSMAGGLINDLAADQGTLMRRNGNVESIDLQRLMNGDLAANVAVGSGDTLSVPRAPQFYVYGEVQKPGVYRLGRNMTMAQAIAMGGGLTSHGTERGALVKRRDSDGKEREYRVRSNDTLQADDVLFIKEGWF